MSLSHYIAHSEDPCVSIFLSICRGEGEKGHSRVSLWPFGCLFVAHFGCQNAWDPPGIRMGSAWDPGGSAYVFAGSAFFGVRGTMGFPRKQCLQDPTKYPFYNIK